jgi:hydroxymethylbilane synthase
MGRVLRIGTRDSQLAAWQATTVQNLLKHAGIASELVYMKSEGDIDIVTPLYELGVLGIFTKTLDAALLNNRIDIAVHSMKDVPTQLAKGIQQAAVLERASSKDIFVYKSEKDLEALGYDGKEWNKLAPTNRNNQQQYIIATGSVRRIAQWIYRYPGHIVENLRGNVNTRLRKLEEHHWNGAIFAAAGLERINLRPPQSVDLDWMLPAPAQGAIMIVCREGDEGAFEACYPLNHEPSAICTKIERDFLRALYGGCSTPISALARIENEQVILKGNVVSPDGKQKLEIEKQFPVNLASTMGVQAGNELLDKGGTAIVDMIRKNGLPGNENH